MRWFVKSPDIRLCSKYVNTDGTSVYKSYMIFKYIRLAERQRLGLDCTRKCRQQAFTKLLQLLNKILSPVSQSTWNSIKKFVSSFSICFIPGSRNWFCLLQYCDRRMGRQADINPVDRDFRENTWDFSWNISRFMFLVSISLVTQDCTTANSHFMHLPFLPLGSYFLLPVFLVHRGVISLNSSAAILQLSLIPFRAGFFPCLRH